MRRHRPARCSVFGLRLRKMQQCRKIYIAEISQYDFQVISRRLHRGMFSLSEFQPEHLDVNLLCEDNWIQYLLVYSLIQKVCNPVQAQRLILFDGEQTQAASAALTSQRSRSFIVLYVYDEGKMRRVQLRRGSVCMSRSTARRSSHALF